MAIVPFEIVELTLQLAAVVKDTADFEKTVPADIDQAEKNIRIAEFIFPKVCALARAIIADVKS